MNLNISEKWEPFIRSKMQTGRYASEDEVLDEALRVLKQRDATHLADEKRVEALLLEGLDSGLSTAMIAEDWEQIEQEGQRLIVERRGRNAT